MESKAEKYKKELLEAIKKHKLMRFDHAFGGFVSFSRRTAYDYGLHELHDIKEALFQNRSNGVNYLIQKWIRSDNATLQVAAMRMICESEDHQRLNQQYTDLTSNGQTILVKLPDPE